jgi:hypothetical protein
MQAEAVFAEFFPQHYFQNLACARFNKLSDNGVASSVGGRDSDRVEGGGGGAGGGVVGGRQGREEEDCGGGCDNDGGEEGGGGEGGGREGGGGAAAADEDALTPGTKVLIKESTHNGKHGSLLTFDKGRWAVRLCTGESFDEHFCTGPGLLVKPSNLQRLVRVPTAEVEEVEEVSITV